ncbi:hypothetical protein YB2330_001442 [Saitoella coloradoensis]
MGDQFNVKIDFVSACNLPVGDFFHGDSDPYIIATIYNNDDDDSLTYRTDTVHSSTEPTWNNDWWQVTGVRSGARLELKLEDEDPDKHTDDKLGEGQYMLDNLGALVDEGEKEIEVHIHKRKSNPRILLGTALLGMIHPKRARARAMVKLRITITKAAETGRLLLLGPRKYSIHRSPLVGRVAGTTDTDDAPAFLAFRLQLLDVPHDLHFEYTKARPEIVAMFADNIKGRLIRRAVKSQHDTIYGYDRKTITGRIERDQMAAVLLEMTDCVEDREGRTKDKLFTYAITLDGVLHFTETGSQYMIDHLSKHSMHANAAPVVVCSGEFFIRRRGREDIDGEDDHGQGDSEVNVVPEVEEAIMENAAKVQQKRDIDNHQVPLKPKINLSKYILVIDNDSGTYMPSADRLPDFQKFLKHNLPGLEVRALGRDDEKLKKWKEEHHERKEEVEPVGLASGGSGSSASSVSSVDDRKEVNVDGFMGKLRGWRTALSGLGS